MPLQDRGRLKFANNKQTIPPNNHYLKLPGMPWKMSVKPNTLVDLHLSPLELETPFTDYIFIDIDQRRLDQLERLKQNYDSTTRIHLRKRDCNDYLCELLKDIPWKQWRGVVFLDPFGMQVPLGYCCRNGEDWGNRGFHKFPRGHGHPALTQKEW